jgi:cobalt-zinc-cadmium efflux system outer membrane protein
VPAGDAEALATRARDASPAVRLARARQARAAGSLALERARRMPDLTVAGGYKRTGGVDSAVAGVFLPIPLFDRNRSGIATAVGGARAAERECATVEALALAEALAVVEAARTLGEQARRVDDEVLKPAALVRTAARSAFREGATDILNLVDAERVYLDASREALQLKLDAAAAAIEARLLLGERILP